MALTYSFPNFEPVCYSMSGSSYCFLTCIQISQGAGKVISDISISLRILQFDLIHTVEAFTVVNEAEIDVIFGIILFFR